MGVLRIRALFVVCVRALHVFKFPPADPGRLHSPPLQPHQTQPSWASFGGIDRDVYEQGSVEGFLTVYRAQKLGACRLTGFCMRGKKTCPGPEVSYHQ